MSAHSYLVPVQGDTNMTVIADLHLCRHFFSASFTSWQLWCDMQKLPEAETQKHSWDGSQ